MNIEIIGNITAEDEKYIDGKIDQFNLKAMHMVDSIEYFEHISFMIKSEEGEIIAGIIGHKYFKEVVYVYVLWVKEEYRGKNLGSQLLEKLETESQYIGCKLVHLDTFGFQAPAFYEKKGYKLYGTLNDLPNGQKRFYYSKLLNKVDAAE